MIEVFYGAVITLVSVMVGYALAKASTSDKEG